MPSVQTGPFPPDLSVNVTYHVTQHHQRSTRGALVDRGANGGLLGSDAIVFLEHNRRVDVTGIDNHEINELKVVSASAKIQTHLGPAIAILHQYAYVGTGRTIHSSAQLEHYKNMCYERSRRAGGRQCIITNDGFVIPIDIKQGLPYIQMSTHTKQEFKELPHVVFTAPTPWDPRDMDYSISNKPDWCDDLKTNVHLCDSPFDVHGEFKDRVPEPEPLITLPKDTSDDEDDEFVPDEDLEPNYLPDCKGTGSPVRYRTSVRTHTRTGPGDHFMYDLQISDHYLER